MSVYVTVFRSRMMRRWGRVARMKVRHDLVRNLIGRHYVGHLNIKMDLREMRCEGVVWIQPAQDRVQ